MINYFQYKTWQEVGGKLVPVCEKPDNADSKYFIDSPGFNWNRFKEDMAMWEESLKISLPIIGDKESIKGRKDLVEGKDFTIKCGNQTCSCASNCGNPVAVLIDNKPYDNGLQANVKIQKILKEKLQQKEDVPNTDAEKQEDELWNREKVVDYAKWYVRNRDKSIQVTDDVQQDADDVYNDSDFIELYLANPKQDIKNGSTRFQIINQFLKNIVK